MIFLFLKIFQGLFLWQQQHPSFTQIELMHTTPSMRHRIGRPSYFIALESWSGQCGGPPNKSLE